MSIQWCVNIYGFTGKIVIYNLICVHTFLTIKLNNSSSTDHRSCTRHATSMFRYDSESVELAEYNGVEISSQIDVE